MKNLLRRKDGMGTVEVVILIAILAAVALIFKTQITEFVKGLIQKITEKDYIGYLYDMKVYLNGII